MFTRIQLKNWKNFKNVNVRLSRRAFIVGPNASGKSNFLDAFRFLRDVADPEGGLRRAVDELRGGLGELRSLHATRNPDVTVEVDVRLAKVDWHYHLTIGTTKGAATPTIKREKVFKGCKPVVERPDKEDTKDQARLTQTVLEQVGANRKFRELASFFAGVHYLHVVPQLIRHPDRLGAKRDPFGRDLLEQLVDTSAEIRKRRLKLINQALQIAVPQMMDLELERDKKGIPHLYGRYKHWRREAAQQSERQFSDGTLRLFGLLWSLQDGQWPLLLEEPELSLHAAILRHLPQMMHRLAGDRQLLVTTHSPDILSDEGISAEEILLVRPTEQDSSITVAADVAEVMTLLGAGVVAADAVLPHTEPSEIAKVTALGR